MMNSRDMSSFQPRKAYSARSIMTGDDDKNSIRKNWDPGGPKPGEKPVLFKPDELDIYCNKVTLEAFIFHGKVIDYDSIDRLEYDHKTYAVDVILKNSARMDLGVKIQWLVRPYFSQAEKVFIAQTKDGVTLKEITVPLIHKNA